MKREWTGRERDWTGKERARTEVESTDNYKKKYSVQVGIEWKQTRQSSKDRQGQSGHE